MEEPMKEKDARVEGTDHQMAVYVEKEDGTYGTIQTGSFMAKNYLNEYECMIRNWNAAHFKSLVKGEYSPVAFYMAERDMTPADVASRMKFGLGKVIKHMKIQGFGTMTIETAARYADLFGVSICELFMLSGPDSQRVQHKKTDNKWVVLSFSGNGKN
jgi:hypothetical protein